MTVPTLPEGPAREQRAFRRLLGAMARPGTVAEVEPHAAGGPFAFALTLLQAVLDHEVTFAVVPDDDQARELLLRYTGSRTVAPDCADFLLARGAGLAAALEAAKGGELEYPDRGATVVALVDAVDACGQVGERTTLIGPGVRGSIDIWVAGFGPEEQALLARRNSDLPQGVDLVLLGPDGRFTCLPRYARVVGTEASRWGT